MPKIKKLPITKLLITNYQNVVIYYPDNYYRHLAHIYYFYNFEKFIPLAGHGYFYNSRSQRIKNQAPDY